MARSIKSTKQPRASIACSRNRDPEYLKLARTVEGLATVAFFDALLCAAKDQGNGGVFRSWDDELLSNFTGTPPQLVPNFLATLLQLKWLVDGKGARTGCLLIRNYAKWNESEKRGGKRVRAGRKSKRNQNEIKPESKGNQNEPPQLQSQLQSHLNERTHDFESPQFERDFWDEYPPIPNKANANRRKTEDEWWKLSPAERSQAAVAVKAFSAAIMAEPPERRKKVIGPVTFLNNKNFDPALWANDKNMWGWG